MSKYTVLPASGSAVSVYKILDVNIKQDFNSGKYSMALNLISRHGVEIYFTFSLTDDHIEGDVVANLRAKFEYIVFRKSTQEWLGLMTSDMDDNTCYAKSAFLADPYNDTVYMGNYGPLELRDFFNK